MKTDLTTKESRSFIDWSALKLLRIIREIPICCIIRSKNWFAFVYTFKLFRRGKSQVESRESSTFIESDRCGLATFSRSFGFCFDKIADEQPVEYRAYQCISRKWELKSNRTCSLELARPSSAIDLADRSFIILLTPSSNIASVSRMIWATRLHSTADALTSHDITTYYVRWNSC